MLKSVVVVGALIAALMAAVKDGRVLQSAGLTGSCSVVATLSDGSQTEACRPGKLEGAPDLSRDGCTQGQTVATIAYWHCPAPVAGQRGS